MCLGKRSSRSPARVIGTEQGQHMLEFAILLSIVTLAAVTMQFAARLGLQGGIKAVSDVVLGPPPAPKAEGLEGTVTVQLCDNQSSLQRTGKSLVVQVACVDAREEGDRQFKRMTTTFERVRGASVNEEARLQVFKE